MGIEPTSEGWEQLKGSAYNSLGVLSCRSQALKANGQTFGPLPSPESNWLHSQTPDALIEVTAHKPAADQVAVLK